MFEKIRNWESGNRSQRPIAGLAGWLLGRVGSRERPLPRLSLLERITIAPRQTVALIEVEGRRVLLATSAEGAPALLPLDSGDDRRTVRGPRALDQHPGKTRRAW